MIRHFFIFISLMLDELVKVINETKSLMLNLQAEGDLQKS